MANVLIINGDNNNIKQPIDDFQYMTSLNDENVLTETINLQINENIDISELKEYIQEKIIKQLEIISDDDLILFSSDKYPHISTISKFLSKDEKDKEILCTSIIFN